MLFDESICNRIDSNIRILLHNIWAVNRLFLSYAFNYCVIFVIIPQRYTVPRSAKADRTALEELFIDEIREFNENYGINE